MIGDLNWKPETNLYGLAPGVDPNHGRPIRTKLDAHVLNVFSHKTTLILRPLSSMTEQEAKEIEATKALQRPSPVHHIAMMVWTAESYRWALSKGFDLFGLIDSGLAINAETLK